jgi:UDP-N-acetylmuramyl tripeptide synthase
MLDPERNPGRTNLFELGGRVVVVDYAHNEAGMRGLVEVCQGLRRPGADVWLTFGTAGDRTEEILHGLAYLAARGSDHLAVAELLRYLRGRDRDDLVRRLQAGAVDGGAADAPVYEDEVTALRAMLSAARPGDVVAITALAQRPEVFALLDREGATRPTPARVRQLVRRARAGATARRRAE